MPYIVCDLDGTLIKFDDKPQRFSTRMKQGLNKWFKGNQSTGSFEIITREKCLELINWIPTWDNDPIEC